MKTKPTTIEYPDSDGERMADNTEQFDWIVMLKGEIGAMYNDREDVFVAGDLLWYPVEGSPAIRVAPDALVAFGRPKGYRGSYKQWEEGGIAPQVVFEVISPGNTIGEMAKKLQFYERHGVEEYYIIDPEKNDMTGYIRQGEILVLIEQMKGWISPRLAIEFDIDESTLNIYRPDKRPFMRFEEIEQLRHETITLARTAEQRAEQEKQRAEILSQKLRSLGIDPDSLAI